jgi:hypothetical protein
MDYNTGASAGIAEMLMQIEMDPQRCCLRCRIENGKSLLVTCDGAVVPVETLEFEAIAFETAAGKEYQIQVMRQKEE